MEHTNAHFKIVFWNIFDRESFNFNGFCGCTTKSHKSQQAKEEFNNIISHYEIGLKITANTRLAAGLVFRDPSA